MIVNNKKLCYSLILATLVLLVVTLPAAAQLVPQTPPPNTTTALAQRGPTDPAELGAFLDAFFTEKMENLHIPGVAFVMVKDGEIFFSKGYGYADLKNQIPVDPEQTIFRIGSVSKLFTATAAMQLVEQGLIDLNTDVNQYLKRFQLPDTYPEPVTLAHLLTHTAGFEDRFTGIFARTAAELVPLGDYLATEMPSRVIPPGSVHSYSNHSYGLAGFLVEEVSGVPFAQYVDENILQPLGMDHTTFLQPLPATMVPDLAVGYEYGQGAYEAVDFIYLQMPAEGGLSASAGDMAAFMVAHLESGRYNETRILEEATARQMHQQQFTHHPELPGLGYGFKERFINGERVIGHGGDIPTFSSQMILLPEHNQGFYVSYNIFSDVLREDLVSAFFDRYYPSEGQDAPRFLTLSQGELGRFEGAYRWTKYSRDTLDKVIAFPPGLVVNVSSTEDGNLSLSFFGAAAEWLYAPVEPLVFKQVAGGSQMVGDLKIDTGETLAFREDESGRITYMFPQIQSLALEKLAWWESSEAQIGSFGVMLLVFLTPLIIWPIGWIVGRLRKRTSRATAVSIRARWLAGITSGLNLVFVLGFLFSMGPELVFGLPLVIKGLLVIPIVTSLLTLVIFGMTILAWKDGYWSILGRVHYSLITLAALVFILWANYWNLLGFRF